MRCHATRRGAARSVARSKTSSSASPPAFCWPSCVHDPTERRHMTAPFVRSRRPDPARPPVVAADLAARRRQSAGSASNCAASPATSPVSLSSLPPHHYSSFYPRSRDKSPVQVRRRRDIYRLLPPPPLAPDEPVIGVSANQSCVACLRTCECDAYISATFCSSASCLQIVDDVHEQRSITDERRRRLLSTSPSIIRLRVPY